MYYHASYKPCPPFMDTMYINLWIVIITQIVTAELETGNVYDRHADR